MTATTRTVTLRSRRRVDTDTWRQRANCRGVDPDLFFPGQGEPTEPAKEVCQGCQVRAECLADAMTTPVEKQGVWGGLSERERRQLRRQRLLDALAQRRARREVA